MDRRGFLLGTLGAIASLPACDFMERVAEGEWQRVILPYRMVYRNGAAQYVQAPGVASVISNGAGSWTFEAEPLLLCRDITLDRVVLLTPDGRTIRETRFSSWCSAKDCDTITVCLTLSAAGYPTIEELVDDLLAGKHGV